MTKKTRRILPYGLLAVVLIVVGCPTPTDEPTVETIDWEEVGGYYVYQTNEDANLDTGTSYSIIPGTTVATESEIQIIKESGNSQGWFGMIFNREDKDNYYVFLVRISGDWLYYKVEAGTTSASIGSGTLPAAIDHGYGKTLTLNASYPATSPVELSVNGTNIFTDTSNFVPFTGDAVGGIAWVEDVENFPDDPVEVKFKITKPFTAP